MPDGPFYTYLWLRQDGTPYYVGKGKPRRLYVKHRVGNPPPKERIILQDWQSEEDAIIAERLLIAFYGREDLGEGRLLNLTDGGEGVVRMRQSEAHRRKISIANKGRIVSEETRKKIGAANKGKSHPGLKGRIITPTQRAKISLALRGRPGNRLGSKHTEETKLKMRKPHGPLAVPRPSYVRRAKCLNKL